MMHDSRFRPERLMPAEWEPHDAVWMAWPEGEELWEGHLDGARDEMVEVCRAIMGDGPRHAAAPERIEMLVRDERARETVDSRLAGVSLRTHVMPYGDIWLRDTAPLFVRDGSGALGAVRFEFNGWGGKYRFAGDDEVAAAVARSVGLDPFDVGLTLEGGAVEVDGQGTLITTAGCVLDVNRNPGIDRAAVEAALARALGARTTIWLDGCLLNDHTDGHVDTLARFVAPGRVVCMQPADASDPNGPMLTELRAQLETAVDAAGRRFDVVAIPSPGLVSDDDDSPLPASYLNFYIANRAIVVPVYDSPYDSAAVDALAACFPGRETIGLPARHILVGGGTFHCMTQQQPRP